MKSKKNLKLQADDYASKAVYTISGAILILAVVLCVLEYKSIGVQKIHLQSNLMSIQDEVILEIDVKPTLPPPPIEPFKAPEHVKVVKKPVPTAKKTIPIMDTSSFDPIPVDSFDIDPEPFIEPIFEVVEKEPSFPGGIEKLYAFLSKNIKYPQMAKNNGIQGKVFVQFVINKDGSIEDVKIVKGVHATINKEAKRVVKLMPNWFPGEQRGEAVKVRYTLPIKFRLS